MFSGANEVIKFLNKGECELVILASDCEPIEIIMNLPGNSKFIRIFYGFL